MSLAIDLVLSLPPILSGRAAIGGLATDLYGANTAYTRIRVRQLIIACRKRGWKIYLIAGGACLGRSQYEVLAEVFAADLPGDWRDNPFMDDQLTFAAACRWLREVGEGAA